MKHKEDSNNKEKLRGQRDNKGSKENFLKYSAIYKMLRHKIRICYQKHIQATKKDFRAWLI